MSELGATAAAVESAAVADMVTAEARAEETAAYVEVRKDEIAAGVEMNRQNNETAERIAEIAAEADKDEDEDRWQSCENRLASLETTMAGISGQLTALQSLIPPPPPPSPEPEPEPEPIPVETPPLPLSEPAKSEATKEKPKPGGLLGWLVW